MDTMAERDAGVGPGAGVDDRLLLRLYIAGSAPNSRQAQANLLALLERAGAQHYRLEVVDCFAEPQRALQDGVLVTPTLLKLHPPPCETVIGTLSDARRVALTLGLLGDARIEAKGGGRGDD